MASPGQTGTEPPPLRVTDVPPRPGREEWTLVVAGCERRGFQQFLAEETPQEVASLFARVVALLDGERGLTDYHLKVKDTRQGGGWDVVVLYGGRRAEERDGPIAAARCMSCEMDCPLSMGLTGKDDGGPTSRDTLLFTESETINCWLDAKARPVLIFAPARHVRRLGELDEGEMVALWGAVGRAMREWGVRQYTSVVVNHGTAQNHAHMHLKVWLRQEEFDAHVGASGSLRATIEGLEAWVLTLPMESQGRWRQQAAGRGHGHGRGRGWAPNGGRQSWDGDSRDGQRRRFR
eukprot:jgi/Tetstr1/445652/TSEL_003457.t1